MNVVTDHKSEIELRSP